jgi:L-iditol 2-dehydrogenase
MMMMMMMMMTVVDEFDMMRAALFYAPLDVRVERVPLPVVGAGEVLVRVGVALTCGTDLKCYRRDHPVLLGVERPARFGHEFSGVIVAVGEGVLGFSVGDRVVAVNSAPCGRCFYCERGQANLCEYLTLLNGAYAEYILVPANIVAVNMYRLPEGLPFEVAAFTEPLAVALRGVLDLAPRVGDSVAIIGLGPIGQLMVKVATLMGLRVTALGRSGYKLAMAQSFGGAVSVVDVSAGFDAEAIKVAHSPEGRGFDLVIEAVGLPLVWQQATQLARRGGKVHWFAGCAGGSVVELDTTLVHYNELTLYSLFHHTPVHVRRAFEYLCSGELDPRPLLLGAEPFGLEGVGFKYVIRP